MLSEVIGRFVDRQRWLDGVGDALGKVAGVAFDHFGPMSKPIEDTLHGTSAGHPVHPALTDIPIGAWTATLALDLAGIEDGADFTLDLGLVGAISAAVAGLADWRYLSGTQRRTGAAHALLNVAGTVLYGASSLRRHSGNRAGATTLSNLGYVCVIGGGYLGGDLVYGLGTMVNRNAWLIGKQKFTAVMPLDDLDDNKPTKAEAHGEPIVLIRRGSQIYALADRCAHLGGPLSEGKLEGDCIVCPWHASQFKLEDGRVMAGPSAYNQPSYAARIREGMVQVRLEGAASEREP